MSGSEQLNIDITAKDSASKVIDPLQKKVETLEKVEPEIAVGADTKAATKAIDGIETDAKGLDKLDPEISVKADTSSANRDVDSFAQKLQKLGAEDQVILLSLRAADVQGQLDSLKTELATLDSDDTTIDVKVENISELETELDGLKTKIKAVADTPIDQGGLGGNIDGVTTKLQDMGDRASKTGDAVHSMAGNAIGDFAATASGIGPLGEALGQLTETALSGEAGLKGLAKAGLGLGAISVAMLVVNNVMGSFAKQAAESAKIKAFNVQNAKEFVDAVTSGTGVVQHYIDIVKETGKVEVAPNAKEQTKALKDMGLLTGSLADSADQLRAANIGVTHGIKDIGGALVAANQNAESFYAAALDPQKFTEFETAIKHSSLSLADQAAVLSGLVYQRDQFAAGQDEQIKKTALTALAQDQVNQNVAEGAGLLNGLAASTDATSIAQAAAAKSTADLEAAFDLEATATASAVTDLESHVAALQADAQAEQDRIDAQRAATDSTFALHKATADYTGADKDLAAALKAAGKNTDEQTVAFDNHTQAAIAVADATQQVYEKTIKASGGTETATQKVDAFNHALADQATSKIPGANDAILDYIGKVNGIPPDKLTDIKAQFNKDGDLDKAKAALDAASETRKAAIVADADTAQADADLDTLAKKKRTVILTPILAGSKFASGGTVGKQGGIAGESGPEFAEFGGTTVLLDRPTPVPPGTRVTSVRKTRSILQRRIPRYANGTGSDAALPFSTRPILFQFNQNAPVYGVEDLNAQFNAWGRQIAATIAAGRR